MTSTPRIVEETEAQLRSRADELTTPRDKECLCCYVARLLPDFPCDGSLRHAAYYRDRMAPAATALENRLSEIGGFCDCEIFLNGYQLPDGDSEVDPDVLPPCGGVPRGSVQPCGNWVRIRRW